MDLKSSKYSQDPTQIHHFHEGEGMIKDEGVTKRNTGRTGLSFGVGLRKNFPSKWDDAEKWLISGHDSPAHGVVKFTNFMSKQCGGINGSMIKQEEKHDKTDMFSDESMLLKDKVTNEVEPIFPKVKCLESMNEGFVFKNSMINATMEVIYEAKNRDTGTEMTPTGSSTTSRSPTPMKSLSPPRHNTPLALKDQNSSFDISELQECHLAKLQPWTPFDSITSNWNSREEEAEEISKSLRYFEMNNECAKTISGPRPSAWEEKEMYEPCIRYKIQEAKILAWVNLQNAKAEAQSRKLEVKIQKMKSKHEEKTMKKMTIVHRKAEELRAAAQLEHSEMSAKSNKSLNRHPNVQFSGHHGSCGCLISNKSIG